MAVPEVSHRRGFDYIMHILYSIPPYTCTYQLLEEHIYSAEYYATKQNNTNIEAALGFLHLCRFSSCFGP